MGIEAINVALFLPFGCNNERQMAAKTGTRRRRKIGGIYEEWSALREPPEHHGKGRL